MAIAQDIIDRASRLLGQIASGASASSDESADGLEALNAMIESWRNERLMCYARQDETLTLANSDGSYTIGPSGDLNTTRPMDIEEAYIVASNISYPVKKITEEEYAAIPDKTTEADWPEVYLYRPTMATGTLLIWPEPNATRTMKLVTRIAVTGFALVSTSVSLPPGWEEALAFNLAVAWAPEFEREPSQAIVKIARESKANIKRTNWRPSIMGNELGTMFGRYVSRIETDQ